MSKTHISCPLFIVIRTLKFLEGILISITDNSSRYNENEMEEQIITKKQGLVEGRKSKVTDQRLGKGLKTDATVGQRLKIRGQRSKVGSEVKLEVGSEVGWEVAGQRPWVRGQRSKERSDVESEIAGQRGRRSEIKNLR